MTSKPTHRRVEEKISDLKSLGEAASRLKAAGRRVVQCHGTFDLVHLGHIRHFRAAKREGDVLLVTLTADEYCRKGPGRPVFTEALRAENIASLECVDYVAICHEPTAVSAINTIRPDVYAKGSDYLNSEDDVTGAIEAEKAAAESHGGCILFTDEITFSSSNLLNEHFGIFSPETRDYLGALARRYGPNEIGTMLRELEGLSVLVIGDAIIDRYTFTTALGQTGKGNFLSVKRDYSEQYAGGVMAVANHVADFAGSVTMVTGLGGIQPSGIDYRDFIEANLKANVEPVFFPIAEAQTVVKERFVDGDLNKLFEIYYFEAEPRASQEEDQAVQEWLSANVEGYDVVIVPDYGNGFITQGMIQNLSEKAKFLAVNTQVNSGNRGYHVISRYPKADLVALNEPELRLALHNRHDPIEDLAKQLAERMQVDTIAVTQGAQGLFALQSGEQEPTRVPALAAKVIDRVGAGDAFLSLASLTLGAGLPMDLSLFLGSAAAAMDVQIVGNRETVESVGLQKYVTALLK